MTRSPYTIRNYQPADFDKYIQLRIKSKELEPDGHFTSPQFIADYMGRPNYSPEHDLFVIEELEDIIGYIDVSPELTIGVVNLDCWIHPEHRRRGLAKRLLGCATQRARELGAELARVNTPEDNTITRDVLSRLDFQCVRRYLVLRLDMTRVSRQDMEQAAQTCRHLKPGEQDKLTYIQNLAFTGHWGFNPNTVEEIIYSTTLSSFSPEDVVFACDGDKVIGYCWSGISDDETSADERKGYINMIGTDPDYRGGGVGKRVLLAGLAYLNNKGVQVTELTVDSENKAALELYRSVGFEVRYSNLWYEKTLD